MFASVALTPFYKVICRARAAHYKLGVVVVKHCMQKMRTFPLLLPRLGQILFFSCFGELLAIFAVVISI